MTDDQKKVPGYTPDSDAQNKKHFDNQGDLGQKGGEATQDSQNTQMPTDEENDQGLKPDDKS